ncbi:ABC transporter permease [Sedimentibacter saalensis]|uniref:Simple sugar transport system permease protein n=1 Tax=Sedimentibacter saalensis TaxID=130788 RepID=A0A562J7G4_9FIRM|nr:ABC transporter permease [Sedimentibacter saalensis]TWH79040.1 simple sugar transport system permease protein [Sedimentibacter saalensis]
MNSNTKFNVLRTVLSVGIALLISFGIIFLTSKEPVNAIVQLLTGPLQSQRRFGNVIEAMIPLIFTGVGVSIMFAANEINLAGEGAFHLGGLVATYVALNTTFPSGISSLACILAAGFFGAMVTTVPAVLKIKTESDVLVSSLMMNYLILYFANYVLSNFLRDPNAGAVVSFAVPQAAQLNTIFTGTRIHIGLFIALAVAVFGYIFMFKTKIGYELRLTGENRSFARYSGINVIKITLISQLIGGFIFGIGGGVELLGMYNRFTWTSLLGYGWDAIIITTLAKKNPLYVPFAAFFLAYLRTGASIMARSTDVVTEIVTITQGIIILLVVAEQFLSKYKHKMIAKEAKATLTNETEGE